MKAILLLLLVLLLFGCVQQAEDSQEVRNQMKTKCVEEARALSTVHVFEGGCEFVEDGCLCKTERGGILIYDSVLREAIK